jgi:hypothetical protein
MRLWTLHPQYLDARGLVALWREALLAQAVLRGRTRGYTRHPQLERFRSEAAPVGSVAEYLRAIQQEASRRGYSFAASRISRQKWEGQIEVSRGQLTYEWQHLRRKLAARDVAWLRTLSRVTRPLAHPLFRVVPGPVAEWERR